MQTAFIVEGADPGARASVARKLRNILDKCRFIETNFHDLQLRGQEARWLAGAYFHPLAQALQGAGSVLITGSWLACGGAGAGAVGLERQRLLERAALTLGAIVINTSPSEVGATELPVYYADPSWSEAVLADHVAAWLLANPSGMRGPGAGPFSANTLIVCDRPNSARQGQLKHRLPLFSFGAGASLWLAHSLGKQWVSERELYWVNAYDGEGISTDPDFINQLLPRHVITLGKAAAEWVKAAELDEEAELVTQLPSIGTTWRRTPETCLLAETIRSNLYKRTVK